MNNYKIGQIAQLFNLNAETLRYYERHNLVQTHRSPENNYRYFDDIGIQTIASIKRYRNMDFTLNEIQTIHTSIEKDELISIIDHKIDDFYQEIKEKEAVIQVMAQNRKYLENIDTLLNTPILIKNKSFYLFKTNFKVNNPEDDKTLQYLFNKSPLSSNTTIICNESLLNNQFNNVKGMIVKDKHSSYFNPILNQMEKVVLDSCVRIAFKLENGKFNAFEILQKVTPYLLRNNLEICGYSYTEHIANFMYNNDAIHYAHMYFQVQHKTK